MLGFFPSLAYMGHIYMSYMGQPYIKDMYGYLYDIFMISLI